MEFLANLVPSEEHHGNKGTLDEEGHDTLNCQRSAKDITNKPRVVTPVCTKLKFEYNTRCNANCKVDTEKSHPEFGDSFPLLVASFDIQCLHKGNNNRES